MKKRLLLILICIISVFIYTGVSALECAPVESSKRRIANRIKEKKVSVYLYTDTNGNAVKKQGYFYFLNLSGSGEKAFCIDMGKPVGEIYLPKPEIWDTFSEEQKRVFRKAYNYADFIASQIETQPEARKRELQEYQTAMSYIVPQLASWIASESPSGATSEHFSQSIISAFCSIYVNPDDTDTTACNWEPNGVTGESYKQTAMNYGNVFGYFIGVWGVTPEYAGDLVVYESTESGRQRLISTYHCEERRESCWKLETDIPNSCESGTNSGRVNDIKDWDCIFKSTTSSNRSVKNHYIEYGINDAGNVVNPYCQVYCREEINFELPKSGVETFQGSYLTVNEMTNSGVNNISPISYDGEKICRPTSSNIVGQIDHQRFETDYEIANLEVKTNWEAYQTAIARRIAVCENARIQVDSSTDSSGWKRTGACKSYWSKDPVKEAACERDTILPEADISSAYDEFINNYNSNLSEDQEKLTIDAMTDGQKNSATSGMLNDAIKQCKDALPNDYCKPSNAESDYEHIRTYTGATAYNGIYYGSVEDWTETDTGKGMNKEAKCSYYQVEELEKKATYEEKLQERQRLIDLINFCVDEDGALDIEYEFEPYVTISYEEEIYGKNRKWTLVPLDDAETGDVESSSIYRGGDSVSGTFTGTGIKVLPLKLYYSCGSQGQACSVLADKTYNTSEWWESRFYSVRKYTLEKSVYRYVEKGIGQSVHASDIESGIEYADMGFGNLPIHYSTTPNRNYIFTLDTKSFGGENKFTSYIFGSDKFNGEVYYDEYDAYECPYDVLCDPMISHNPACPGTPTTGDGLNLVYRTISLLSKVSAFPGSNGLGRTPGANWNDDELISTFITNNRNVSNYSIYTELDPLYEIELTPKIMSQLRKYNKKKKSTYTVIYRGTSKESRGSLGYTDYNDFVCDDDGTNCKSKLLRGMLTDYSEVNVTGCAISGTTSGYNCSIVDESWYIGV